MGVVNLGRLFDMRCRVSGGRMIILCVRGGGYIG